MNISSFARLFTILTVLVSVAAPAVTHAATPEPPACLMAVLTKEAGTVFTTDTVTVNKGSWVYVLWVSTSNSIAYNSNNAVVAHSGFVYAIATASATYAFRFTAGGEEVTCSATLKVVDPSSNYVLGPTTLRVASVPLLSGGLVAPGTSVPVAYVQVANVGSVATILKGFEVRQTGSAPTSAITELGTVDDTGLFSASTSGTRVTPFQNDVGLAPADVVMLPGQQRLFTVRAGTSYGITQYGGTQIILDVTGLETSPASTIQGTFPVRGTAWTIR